jgi:DNA-binding MarR family transcriptional regulator
MNDRGGPPGADGADTAAVAERLLSAMGLIRRTGRRGAGRPKELMSLTASQLELLRLVRRHPGISVTNAAAELHLVPNTVSTLVGQLTSLGLLVRRPDRHDRRVARLDLNPETGRQVEAWRDRRVALLATTIDALGAGDRRRIAGAAAALERLADRLEAGDDASGSSAVAS